jgi:alkylhydroperoxidase/carboxymuconolactone decarboxylase family protein YurZ
LIYASYYLSEDLARFGDISKTNPELFELFLKWYSTTMEPGALDARTKKLIAYAVANAIQEPYCIGLLCIGMHRRGHIARGDGRSPECCSRHSGRRYDRSLDTDTIARKK